MYVNQFDVSSECAKTGKSAEDLFEKFLKDTKKKYRRANLAEQYNHVDFVVHLNRDIKIDVKGPKKISRSDTSNNNELIWVEFVNVRGEKGWLYGKNDLIAFYQTKDKAFYVVRTKDLAELCEKICDNKRVLYAQEALYHKYTRFGRKDILSMIKFEDLLKLHYTKIPVCQEVEENHI